MKGFTIIELVVVIGILAVLSLASYTIIINFQKDVLLDDTSREFAAQVRAAKAKSQAGEVKIGESYSDDGYPKFGIETTTSSYYLKRQYKLSDGPHEESEATDLDPKLSLSVNTIYFGRITGIPSAETDFTLTRIGASDQRKIHIDTNGIVTVIKL